MDILMIVIFFAVGIALGSFVNAWVWRTKEGKSVAKGRSMCPDCKHQLSARDNIPVISYLLLKGRCRYCNKPISIQYPLVELITSLLFVALYMYFSPSNPYMWIQLLAWSVATVLLVSAFVYDLRWMILPDKFTLPVIAIAIGLLVLQAIQFGISSIFAQIVATLIFAGLYLAIWVLSKGKLLGGGDIRLALLMGLLLTVPQLLVGVFVAYTVGALVGVLLIAIKLKKRTDAVPLAPFLIFGLYFGLFFGNQISSWYLSMI
jgi:leader peptidase (prepilin peptidase)/N-methyltransferase